MFSTFDNKLIPFNFSYNVTASVKKTMIDTLEWAVPGCHGYMGIHVKTIKAGCQEHLSARKWALNIVHTLNSEHAHGVIVSIATLGVVCSNIVSAGVCARAYGMASQPSRLLAHHALNIVI